MTRNATHAATQLRTAAEMAAHLIEMSRCFAPDERADVVAELIDKAIRRGAIDRDTAAQLHERAAEICAAA